MMLSARFSCVRDDRGIALPMVLGIGVVLLTLMMVAATLSMSGMKKSSTDADWNGALAAAYAGVDEYQSRLDGDSSYAQYGNMASAFSIATGSSLITPLVANPAFDVTAAGSWGTVPGSDGTASFRYEVDNSKFTATGVLKIRSTGRVGDATRSVVADLKGKGFIDFLYFTDYEIQDPAFTLNGSGTTTCANPKHAWEVAGYRYGCQEITFGSGDELKGPVHSNDIMHICDAKFTGNVTSAYPTSPYYKNTTGGDKTSGPSAGTCSGQNFAKTPTQSSSITMPPTNSDMRKETQVNLPTEVPRAGCLYTGPTKITFTGDGFMTVRSPWTNYTRAGAIQTPAAGVTLEACGTPGLTGLGSAAGQSIKVPDNNLVYVQGVSATPGDPNYWSSSTRPPAPGFGGCTGVDTSVSGNGLGYPTKVGTRSEKAPSSTAYECRNGDLFVEGAVKGRVTLAASNYVYVTGNITYKDPDLDTLGLVGGKAVWVWNPINTANAVMLTDTDRTIHAAILSVENTFMVQNYNTAPSRGKLYVTGAIAQKYRGIVSQSGGYIKRYVYDTHFETAAPPKFLSPVSTTYGTTSIADVAAAFESDGTAVPLP